MLNILKGCTQIGKINGHVLPRPYRFRHKESQPQSIVFLILIKLKNTWVDNSLSLKVTGVSMDAKQVCDLLTS